MSLITNAALPVPTFVKVNCEELDAARVRAIFPYASVALIVLPDWYACCKVTFKALAVHCVISWVELSRHKVVLATPAAGRDPSTVVFVKTISPVPLGVRVKSSLLTVVISVPAPAKVSPLEPMVLLVSV